MKLAKLKAAVIVAVLLLLFGIAGRMDADDEEAQNIFYCENVKARIWPDYEGTFEKFCKKSSSKSLTSSKK